MSESNDDLLLLENLIINNFDLEELEFLLDEFNIFEALGAVRQELRHSDFLAFLLNPSQKHGLGTAFGKRVLQVALAGISVSDYPVSAIDIDIWDLDDLEIHREWHNIDILLVSNHNNLVVAIENKISSSEHSNQLERYVQTVEQHYHEAKGIYIYLSPEGEEPSHEKYLSVSYEAICEILEKLNESRSSTIGQDIHTLISHYTKMLRRYILSGSEIEQLAQQIYRKHQQALDLIYEYRPDQQQELYRYLNELIGKNPDFIIDHSTKSYILFLPRKWDFPTLKVGEGWTASNRLLLFSFENAKSSLKLKLGIGPGPKEIRQKLLDIAKSNEPPFKSAYRALNLKWNNIMTKSILTSNDYEERTIEEHQHKISKAWENFLTNELPEMTAILEKEGWI